MKQGRNLAYIVLEAMILALRASMLFTKLPGQTQDSRQNFFLVSHSYKVGPYMRYVHYQDLGTSPLEGLNNHVSNNSKAFVFCNFQILRVLNQSKEV